MKKAIVLVLAFFLICTAVYAEGFTLRSSVGFNGFAGKTNLPALQAFEKKDKTKASLVGINFKVGADYTFDNNVVCFGDVSIGFPLEAKISNLEKVSLDQKKSMGKKDFKRVFHKGAQVYSVDIAFDFGAGYKFDFKGPISVTVGGGFAFDGFNLKINDKKGNEKHSVVAIGFNLHTGIDYNFSDHWAVYCEVDPNLMFLEWTKSKMNNKTVKDDLFRINCSYQATIGAAYKF